MNVAVALLGAGLGFGQPAAPDYYPMTNRNLKLMIAYTPEERKNQLQDKFDGGRPAPGVLAFRDGSPVGWCAVEPRGCYPRILRSKVLASAPDAARDPGVDHVWSVSCFVVSPGHRRTGVAGALLAAAVEHAVAHGAAVVEGYPVDPAQRPKAGPADLYHGTLGLFLAAGFTVVSGTVVSGAVPGRAVVRLTAPRAGRDRGR